jgi:hypothetical protein
MIVVFEVLSVVGPMVASAVACCAIAFGLLLINNERGHR